MMQKCPRCKMRKTSVQEVRHPDSGKVVRVYTVCTNCQAPLPSKKKSWWSRKL